MTRMAKAMAVLLLVLWMPATLHCKLEALTGLSSLACHAVSEDPAHSDSDCDGDGCGVIESGLYKVSTGVRFGVDFAAPAVLAQTTMDQDVSQPGVWLPQPALIASDQGIPWQFACRTALPPRPPTALS